MMAMGVCRGGSGYLLGAAPSPDVHRRERLEFSRLPPQLPFAILSPPADEKSPYRKEILLLNPPFSIFPTNLLLFRELRPSTRRK
jgi:hypothetical protein